MLGDKNNNDSKVQTDVRKSQIPWFDIMCIFIISVLLTFLFFQFNPLRALFKSGYESMSTDLLINIEGLRCSEQESDWISIVDIGDLRNRGDIAKVLMDVYSMSPKKIGVDIDFYGLQQSVSDSSLMSVVDSIKDKTIFVCGLEGDNDDCIKHSYFCDSQYPQYAVMNPMGKKAVKEGASTLLYKYKSHIIRTYKYKFHTNKEDVMSFAAKMAEDYNCVVPDTIERIITYKPIGFVSMQYDSLKASSIKDRFVLVGKLDKQQDIHNTPLGFSPGILIHAQILECILDGRNIKKNKCIDFILETLFGILFCISLYGFDCWAENLRRKKCVISAYIIDEGWGTIFLTLFFVVLILIVSYIFYIMSDIHVDMHVVLGLIITTATFGKSLYKILLLGLSKCNCFTHYMESTFNSYYFKKITK